ncbi:hypothetical protein, partial [Haloquadratum walsbyi]|uniref:hypothetical protein n=1 Tax=Haloquadratum walsbyi TaxID=293091 RepID=UPI00064ECEE1
PLETSAHAAGGQNRLCSSHECGCGVGVAQVTVTSLYVVICTSAPLAFTVSVTCAAFVGAVQTTSTVSGPAVTTLTGPVTVAESTST